MILFHSSSAETNQNSGTKILCV